MFPIDLTCPFASLGHAVQLTDELPVWTEQNKKIVTGDSANERKLHFKDTISAISHASPVSFIGNVVLGIGTTS